MFKVLSKTVTASLLSLSLVTSVCAMEAPTKALADASPAKVEFAWDIHDVLVKKYIPGMIGIFIWNGGLKTTGLVGMLGFDYLRYACTGTVGKRQQLINDIRALLKKGAVGEEYKALIEKYDPSLWAVAEKMAAEHYPVAGMPELIQELDALGYTQRVASNIGTHEVTNLNSKWPMFSFFKGGKTVDYLTNPAAVKKPNPQYFIEYHDSYNSDRSKTIIFVDDQDKNTKAAQAEGMVAIQFKNTTQLRNELKELGIQLK